jgi:hypothetical protein
MRINHPVRLAACAAIAGSAAFAVVVPGASAFAAVPKVTCTTVNGNATVQALSGCSGTGVGLTGTTGSQNASTNTVTWSTGKTSVSSVTNKILTGKKDKCVAPAGYTNAAEVKIKGSVTGGTALVGSKIKGTLCAFSKTGGGTLVTNFPGKSYTV